MLEDLHETTGAELPPRRPAPASKLPWILFALALAAGMGVTFLLRDKLLNARDDAEHARQATRDLANTLHESDSAKHALEGELQKLQQEHEELAADRDTLSQTVQQKDAELEKLKGTYASLEDRLQSEIKKGDVHLTQVNGKIRVDLVDRVLFDSGQAALSGRGAEVLGRVGGVLANIEEKQIQVSGHTDDSPITERLQSTYATNWELSSARAVNVVRYLSEHAGVPARRLMAAGYGPYQPLASNATPTGRARNRRIEILLLPSLSPQKVAAVAAPAAAPNAVAVATDRKTSMLAAGKKAPVKKLRGH